MKIVRDGKEFELTSQELVQAYEEQQAIFDLLNIEHNLENHVSYEEYTRLKDNADFIEAAAKLLRENQDYKNMDYDTALSQAIYDTARDFSLLVNRVHLIRENASEENVWSEIFWVDDSKKPTKELFVDAIHAFLQTEPGRRAVKETCNDFNWGDAEQYIPDEFWQQYGIYPYDYEVKPAEIGLEPVTGVDSIFIRVNHDEILIPEGYFEHLEESGRKPPLAVQIAAAAPRAGQNPEQELVNRLTGLSGR